MSKSAKYIILAVATGLAAVWALGAIVLTGTIKPYIAVVAAAYPLLVLFGLWAVGVLGAVAFSCAISDDGVTWGGLLFCATMGWPLILGGVS